MPDTNKTCNHKKGHNELLKVSYGLLKNTSKFFFKVAKDFKNLGFKLNPYDGCAANRVVNNKIQIDNWHADDFENFCAGPEVNNSLAKELQKYYDREIGKMQITTGIMHENVVMEFYFSNK